MRSLRAKLTGCSTALILFSLQPVSAAEFDFGDSIVVRTNLTASAGVSVRVEDPNLAAVLAGNGGRIGIEGGTASAATQDDGTLNFDKGDVVNAPLTVLGDLEFVVNNNLGFFVRGKGVFDARLANGDVNHGHAPNGYAIDEPLDDSDFDNLAQFQTVALLDAFAFYSPNTSIPIDLRFGRQVVSWGESLFIQGGINTINPVDLSAFRRPGTELKEGLLPFGMAYANVGLTDQLSVEGFLGLETEQTVLDGCGTFFSVGDIVADGCNEASLASLIPGGNDQIAQQMFFFVPRGNDVDSDDIDDFGLAARYFADSIGAEFGVYFTQLDSRSPIVTYTTGAQTLDLPVAPGVAVPASLPIPGQPDPVVYNIQYAENIRTLGVSVSANAGGVAIAGELSYRPNQPVQINTNDLTTAALLLGGSGAILGFENPADALFAGVAPGTLIDGFIDADQLRGQISMVKFFERALGANRATSIIELGFEYLDFDNPFDLNLGRAPIYGNPGIAGNDVDGLTTDLSAGIRYVLSANYNNLFAGINATPSISLAHDITGNSSDTSFREGRTSVGLGVTFDYLQRYELLLNYTTSAGGEFNDFDDRDFVSALIRARY